MAHAPEQKLKRATTTISPRGRVIGVIQALQAIAGRLLDDQPGDLLIDVLSRSSDALGASAGLTLQRQTDDQFVVEAATGLPAQPPDGRIPAQQLACFVNVAEPALVHLHDDHGDGPFSWLQQLGLTHIVGTPLVAGAQRGLILFCYRAPPARDVLTYAPLFASQYAVAVQLANLKRLNARLQDDVDRRTDSQERFISAVSHELKGPLTNMQGYTQLLIRYPDVPPAQRQRNLETVLAETKRLARLINELTEAARLENGSLELVLQPVSLLALVDDVAKRLTQAPDGQQRVIAIERPPSLPPGYWDRDRLAEAIENLLEHALNETPKDRGVHVTIARDGESAVLRIQSHGEPTEANALRLALIPFYHLEKPARVRGQGLGLPIARLIVERLGGQVWAEPIPGIGNCYSVQIPFRHA